MSLSSTIYVTPTGCFQKSGPRLVWSVEINDGTQTLTRSLADPFNDAEHDACRWYLERYSQDSFDAPKANRGAFKLANYGEGLAKQLELPLSAGDSVDLVISEGALPPDCATRTIHRLYWELLESPSAWGLDTLDLRVRRVSGHHHGLHLPRPSLMPPDSPKIIEILHVAARSRSPTSNHRREVSPQMALTVLAQVSHDLKRHNCSHRLNITTIRPGTFEELKACLNQRREQGGHNMFHLVHFDLHGEANPEKGARLLFEDGGGRLREVSSSDVADALAGFPAPFVVLNACRSARADLGAEANTAAILSRRGCAENILAMSFETLSVAAEAFLRVFYAEFLLRGASFASAARRGRCALQQDNARRGHLNRPLKLSDWFVPVVYGSVQDLAIAPPVDCVKATTMGTSLGDRIVGRNFSVGVLENLLLAHRRACLRGHAGIGKSVFLKYACRIWEETAFADAVVWVDLAPSLCRSRDSIVAMLLDQLSLPLTGSAEESNRLLLSHVQDEAKVLVVVDSLEAAFSARGSEAVPASTAGDTAAFLTQLCNACVEGKRGSMMLFSGRRAGLGRTKPLGNSGSDALSGWLEKSFKECTMELKGLDLGHSMELSENVLRDVGQAPRSVTDPDTRDSLELLNRLFLGIPGAVNFVLRFAHKRGLPWRDVRGRLLDGEPTIHDAFLGALPSWDGLLLELSLLCRTLPPERLAPLLVLGIYWHQGPYEVPFSQAMVSFGVCGSQADAESSLELASERGYIQSASYKRKLRRISFIHPLFTLFCRITLHALFRVVSSTRNNGRQHPQTHLLNAVRFYATVVFKDIKTSLFDSKLLDWFLQDIDHQRAYQIICHDEATSASTAFEIQSNPAAGHFLNTLSCFRLCLHCTVSWPLDHFVGMAPLVMEARMAPEATLFADRYERLLDRLLELEQTALQHPLLVRFFVMTAVNLASLRRFHANANHGSRWRDLLKEARRWCGTLESTGWERSVMRLIRVFEVDGSMASVQALDLMSSPDWASDHPEFLSIEPNVELADSAARGLLRSPELARKIRGQIRGAPDCLRDAELPRSRTGVVSMVRDLALHARVLAGERLDASNASSPEEQAAKLTHLLQNLQASLPPSAYRLFVDRSTEWFLSQPSALTVFGTPGGERELLLGRASFALAAGDWAALRDSYQELHKYHLRRLELRQANEYLEELIRLSEADTATPDVPEGLRRAQRDLVENVLYKGMLAAEVDDGAVGWTTNTAAGPDTAAGSEAGLRPLSYEAWEQFRRGFQELTCNLDAAGLRASKRVGEQLLALNKRIDDAEAQQSWDEALAAAAEIEELCRQEPLAHAIARVDLPTLRPMIEYKRDLFTNFCDWAGSVADDRPADGRRHIERLEQLARDREAGPLREMISPPDENLAFLRWAQAVVERGAASRALPEAGGGATDGEDEAAVDALDGLLSRDESFFTHAKDLVGALFLEELLGEARRARRKHLLRLAVAKGDMAAAEKPRGQMAPPPPVPRVTRWVFVAGLVGVFLAVLVEELAWQ